MTYLDVDRLIGPDKTVTVSWRGYKEGAINYGMQTFECRVPVSHGHKTYKAFVIMKEAVIRNLAIDAIQNRGA